MKTIGLMQGIGPEGRVGYPAQAVRAPPRRLLSLRGEAGPTNQQ